MEQHNHPEPSVDQLNTADGGSIDAAPLRSIVGAAHAGCQPCQQHHTPAFLDGNPALLANLAARRLGIVDNLLNRFQGRPLVSLLEAFERDDPWEAENTAAGMPEGQRQQVLDDALDMVTGLLVMLNPERD